MWLDKNRLVTEGKRKNPKQVMQKQSLTISHQQSDARSPSNDYTGTTSPQFYQWAWCVLAQNIHLVQVRSAVPFLFPPGFCSLRDYLWDGGRGRLNKKQRTPPCSLNTAVLLVCHQECFRDLKPYGLLWGKPTPLTDPNLYILLSRSRKILQF